MRGTPIKLLATGFMACGLFACSSPELVELPVRSSPQDQAPYSPDVGDAPLRGTAVAIALAPGE
ncbi:MAG: hypothetical protein ABJO29_05255 [Yoonia sp.]|uniref:hypothetical protein n=1 Tax=Rhodobacterales TaxID=204455 RepID=UPI001FF1D3F6|nr:hypothetical protein [Loktanella sp. F6476L]MCK0120238.1 hypothetical protein [Loktanella sp. F6476L]UWQ99026.1 hypothetical protein K3729_16695 [Rhodobacteraceae bacterium S2214]